MAQRSYSSFERRVARILEATPAVRNGLKWVYHRMNYLVHREPGFRFAVHRDVGILTVADWVGTSLGDVDYFFGYYDKTPWFADMQQLVMHRLTGGEVDILVCDRRRKIVRVVGKTKVWNYQQGSMAQWLPCRREPTVIYNDLCGRDLVARIVELDGEARTVPFPIQVVHPRRPEALSLNYKRLMWLRPDYGYTPPVANFDVRQDVTRDGIWWMDLQTGAVRLIISLARLMETEPRVEMVGSDHKVNHALYSPEGTRFVFLHRWFGPKGKFSRLYVADPNGENLRILLDHRMVSHYNWLDEDHLLVWGRTVEQGDRYYLIDVRTGERSIVGDGVLNSYGDGHPSYSPDRRWIVTDTYPDKARQRTLLLFEVETGRCIEIGRFFAPWTFDGTRRCDLHPRWSPDGRLISIDSAHDGRRRSYLLDVSAIVGRQ